MITLARSSSTSFAMRMILKIARLNQSKLTIPKRFILIWIICKHLFISLTKYCPFLNNIFIIIAFISFLNSQGLIADNPPRQKVPNSNNNTAERGEEVLRIVQLAEQSAAASLPLTSNKPKRTTTLRRAPAPRKPGIEKQLVHKDNADKNEPMKKKHKINSRNKQKPKYPFIVLHQK